MKKNQDRKTTRINLQKKLILAFFSAILLLLMFTPLGYVPLGPLRITTLHLPVLLGASLLGFSSALFLGFLFAGTSLLINTFAPTVLSFLFSPFIPIPGAPNGSWTALLVCFLPRLCMAGLAAQLSFKISNPSWFRRVSFFAGMSLLHTLIFGMLAELFFGSALRSEGILQTFHWSLLLMITLNGILEALLAGLLLPTLEKVLKQLRKRVEL